MSADKINEWREELIWEESLAFSGLPQKVLDWCENKIAVRVAPCRLQVLPQEEFFKRLTQLEEQKDPLARSFKDTSVLALPEALYAMLSEMTYDVLKKEIHSVFSGLRICRQGEIVEMEWLLENNQ